MRELAVILAAVEPTGEELHAESLRDLTPFLLEVYVQGGKARVPRDIGIEFQHAQSLSTLSFSWIHCLLVFGGRSSIRSNGLKEIGTRTRLFFGGNKPGGATGCSVLLRTSLDHYHG